MSLGEIIKVALKSIKTNKARSVLTMLGVIIGVASVILLVAIVSGLGKTIRNELNSFGANLLVIFPGEPGGGRGPGGVVANKMEFRFADLIEERVVEVRNAVPMIQGIGIAKYKNKDVSNTTIYGVPGTYFYAINISIEEGRAFSENEGSNVVVIGKTIKDKLFSNTSALGKEIIVKDRKYKVIGLQKERGSIFGEDQDNVVIMPLGPARSLLGLDRPNWFFVKTEENKDIKTAKEKIVKVLENELDPDDFTVSTQEDTLALVGRILGVLSLGLGGIAAISLVVGGVGIMNIMLVSVTERTREIGLRKALGARRRDILLQFLTEATILSLFGGLLGVILGILLSLILDRFIATEINYYFVLLSFGVSGAIGIIFGIAPAIRASKLSPIEALRYE